MAATEGPYSWERTSLHTCTIFGATRGDLGRSIFGYTDGADPDANAAKACDALNVVDLHRAGRHAEAATLAVAAL